MKKILISLLVLVLMFSVSAIDQPDIIDIDTELGAIIDQPVAPGTGTQGECTPWEVKDEKCSGDIRSYEQCVQTASGGKWTPKSERCTDYGSNVKCIAGKCQKTEDVSKTVFYVIGALAIIFFVIFFARKKR